MFKKTLALLLALVMVLGSMNLVLAEEEELPTNVVKEIESTETTVTLDETVTETESGAAIGVLVADGTPEDGVTITGNIDMSHEGSYGLVVYDNINNKVYFIGDIITDYSDIDGIALYLADAADVTVNGYIGAWSDRAYGVSSENSTLDVTGNVYGGHRGLSLVGASSDVTVDGSVITGHRGAALFVMNSEAGATGTEFSKVTVTEALQASGRGSAAISAYDGKAIVNADMEATGEEVTGIWAAGDSVLFVTGDTVVTEKGGHGGMGKNYGIYAEDDGTSVTQVGDIDVDTVSSSGIYVEDGAKVCLVGDVEMNGYKDVGVEINGQGNVYVLGSIVANLPDEEEEEEEPMAMLVPMVLSGSQQVVEEEEEEEYEYETNTIGVYVYGNDSETFWPAVVTATEGVSVTGERTTAVVAENGANLVLNADVYANGSNRQSGIFTNSSNLFVNGDVEADGDNSFGVHTVNSNVFVNGDVYGGMRGIFVDDKTSNVFVTGTVSTGAEGAALYITDTKEGATGTANNEITVLGGLVAGGKYSGAITASNANATVNADAKLTGADETAIWADEGSIITLNGDINANGKRNYGIYADGDETFVSMNGDIYLNNDDSTGIYADGGARIDLNGDIYAEGETDTGVYVYKNGEVEVDNIYAGNGSTAVAFKNVQSRDNAVVVVNNEIIVGENGTVLQGSEKTLKNAKLYVYGITLTDDSASLTGEDATDEIFKTNVNYIIRDQDSRITLANGYETDEDLGFTYTNGGMDNGKLTVEVANGYRVDTSKDSRIVRENGNYALYLNDGDGVYGYIWFDVYRLYSVGDTVKVGGIRWKVCGNDNGIFTLISMDTFSDEKLADKEALLKELLSENKMSHVQSIADTPDQELLDKYFGGEAGHLQITADSLFIY